MRISVIVPYYKTPRLKMRKCLDSLLAQTFADFELLVIDDGSGPGYEALQAEYEAADPRVRFVHKEHAGVSAARNLGLELAAGAYIAFVDSDDFAEPTYLETLYRAIQDSDLAVCGIEEQYYPVPDLWVDRRVFFSQPERFAWLQYINFCHNKLFRADVICAGGIRFPQGVGLGEDALFLARYLPQIRSLHCVSGRLYHYVPDANSAVRQYRPQFWEWEQEVIRQQWALFHQYPLSARQEAYAVHWLYCKLKYALYYYVDFCRDKAARNGFLRQILQHPLYAVLAEYPLRREKLVFNRKDRIIVGLWRLLGVRGVCLTRAISKRRR